MTDRYTISEAVVALEPVGICRSTLYEMMRSGELKVIRILNRVFIAAADVHGLLDTRAIRNDEVGLSEAINILRVGRTTVFTLIARGYLTPRKGPRNQLLFDKHQLKQLDTGSPSQTTKQVDGDRINRARRAAFHD